MPRKKSESKKVVKKEDTIKPLVVKPTPTRKQVTAVVKKTVKAVEPKPEVKVEEKKAVVKEIPVVFEVNCYATTTFKCKIGPRWYSGIMGNKNAKGTKMTLPVAIFDRLYSQGKVKKCQM